MATKTLVSLVSAQTLPNVLFILAFKKFDKYIFISTEEMESRAKTFAILKATGLEKSNHWILKTSSDDFGRVTSDLGQLDGQIIEYSHAVVNITGGTKLMAMAVSNYFSKKNCSAIYYLPLNSGYIQKIFPKIETIEFPNQPKLNLSIYFAAHGFDVLGENRLTHPLRRIDRIFDKVMIAGNASIVDELSAAYYHYYEGSDASFLKGGWFEQYIYSAIQREFNLDDSMIMYNLKMKEFNSPQETESDNEIDVAFIYENQLYLVECKVYLSKMIKAFPMQKIQDPMFKLASIRNHLGLSANCIVAYACKINFQHSKQRIDRLNQLKRLLGIKTLIDLEDLERENSISEIVNK